MSSSEINGFYIQLSGTNKGKTKLFYLRPHADWSDQFCYILGDSGYLTYL